MLRLIVAMAAVLVLGSAGTASAQANAAFQIIRDWDVGDARTERTGETLRLASGTIWSPRAYNDFVFRFDYRLGPPAAVALLFRAQHGGDADRREYALALDGSGNTGRLSAVSMPLHQSRFTPPKAGRTRWTSCDVRVERTRLTVTVDGAIVAEGSLLDLPGGRIGFRVLHGDIELRAMRVAPLVDTLSTFHPELPVAGTPGVTLPSLAKHVPPVYPSSARSNGISGTVLMQIVVLPDGLVGDIRVASSPHADLIQAAIACVRKWRFHPALKDGAPVAVAATAEVAFNLTR